MTSRSGTSWHLAGLVLAGAVIESVYLALWVFSYPISQGADWSVAYLTQHSELWDAFRPFLEAAQQRWPEGMVQTEWLASVVTVFFTTLYSGYVLALWCGHRLNGHVTIGVAAIWAIIHQSTLVVIPSLFTTDMFSYATYGRLPAIYGLNPFIHYPALIPYDTIASWIHPVWHYAPSVYGPLWIDLSVLIARSTAQLSAADQVLVYRLVANAAHILNAALVLVVLRPYGVQAMAGGFLLYAWNPLVVFEFAANGHNDAVMITFLLAGFLAMRAFHPSVGIALVTLGTLIKPAAVLVLPLFVWVWVRGQSTWRARFIAASVSGVLVLLLAVVLYAPWYQGPDTFGPLVLWSTISPMYINYVPDFLSLRLAQDSILNGVLWEQAWLDARERVKLGTRILFVAYFVIELWYLRKMEELPAASARVFLAFLVLVNTWVLAWYFTWSLAMVSVLHGGRWLKAAVIGMSLTAMTVIYYHHFAPTEMPDEVYVLYLAPLLIPLLAFAIKRLGRRSPFDARATAPVPQTPETSFR